MRLGSKSRILDDNEVSGPTIWGGIGDPLIRWVYLRIKHAGISEDREEVLVLENA